MSQQESKPKCPKCGSTQLAVERRPDGGARCVYCGWRGPYQQCFQNTNEANKQRVWKIYGLRERLTGDRGFRETMEITAGPQLSDFEPDPQNDGFVVRTPVVEVIEKLAYDHLTAKLEATQTHLETLQGEMEVEAEKYQTLKSKLEETQTQLTEQTQRMLNLRADWLEAREKLEAAEREKADLLEESETDLKNWERDCQERDELKKEVENLKEQIETMRGTPGDYAELVLQFNALKSENKKLREALEKAITAIEWPHQLKHDSLIGACNTALFELRAALDEDSK